MELEKIKSVCVCVCVCMYEYERKRKSERGLRTTEKEYKERVEVREKIERKRKTK